MLQSQYVTIDGKRIHYLSKEPSAEVGKEPSAALGREPSAGLGREPSAEVGKEPSAGLCKEPSSQLGKELTSDNTLFVLFHGFPENAHAWEAFIRTLPSHYDIVAPDLPGYHLSDPLSEERQYEVPTLIKRMATFIEKVKKGRKVILVAHDWGGAIAWPLTAFHPDLIHKLVILNAAHPSTFTQSLIVSKQQRVKSQYISSLRDKNTVSSLISTDFKLLKDMLGETFFEQQWDYASTLLNDWSQEARLSAMLNYYRCMPQDIPSVDASDEELQAIHVPNIHIGVPTLVLWGRNDLAFDDAVLHGIEKYVPHCEVIYHETATHWIHREFPTWASDRVLAFI
ncbi:MULTISPECIES: alpha/beta fold hydrolase [unclassified Alteromonas]|uniref:alpha/beta fold hydrolase n=1 Tax=unclassified Alteromonas TaxID=2614992 RepID=UPI0005523AB1|nr:MULTISPECIES: alpha/beta hydrolase [unclassified Alteromonas]